MKKTHKKTNLYLSNRSDLDLLETHKGVTPILSFPVEIKHIPINSKYNITLFENAITVSKVNSF